MIPWALEHRGRNIPSEPGALARPLVGTLVRILGETLRLHCRLWNSNWSLHLTRGGEARGGGGLVALAPHPWNPALV